MNRFNREDLLIIALGGNAVLPQGASGSIDEQFKKTRLTMSQVARLASSGVRVVISHGNGPIVGNIMLRNLAASDRIPPMPLFVCDADSQGGIGFMIQNALRNELHLIGEVRSVATIVTQVEVDPADPAFANPSKPIGPYYTAEEAEQAASKYGWVIRDDAGRGLRRVVPSPEPGVIVELDAIRRLVRQGVIVIGVGGGGIPVRRNERGLLKGVDAVIDKDLAAAELAQGLSATHMVFVTNTEKVAVAFGKPEQRDLDHLNLAELEGHIAAGEFPAGSMGPKMEAVRRFLHRGGREAFVCSPETLAETLAGRAGTSITRE